MPKGQIGAPMDGSDRQFEPPPSTRGYHELRERAPVLFTEGATLAATYPKELGEIPYIFNFIWAIAWALPDDRADLIPQKEVPAAKEMGNLLRIARWEGTLRPKYGAKTTFLWPGQLIRDLESGLATIARSGTTDRWREAACAAYDLLLRICATLFQDFEIV